MEKKMENKIKKFLKENNIDFVENYFNGEMSFWGFNKDRNMEVIIKFNDNFDEETLKDFNEQKNG